MDRLPEELVVLIARGLRDMRDWMAFRAVCRSWRELASTWQHLEVPPALATLITDDVVVDVARTCHDLRSFSARGCSRLGDVAAMALACHCPRLVEVAFTTASALSDHGVVALSAACRFLRWVCFAECPRLSDRCVGALAAGCPELSSLDMWQCNRLTPGAVAFLAASAGAAVRLGFAPLLQELSLGGTASDVVLLHLAASVPDLRILDVSACHGVSWRLVAELADARPSLEVRASSAPAAPGPLWHGGGARDARFGGEKRRAVRCVMEDDSGLQAQRRVRAREDEGWSDEEEDEDEEDEEEMADDAADEGEMAVVIDVDDDEDDGGAMAPRLAVAGEWLTEVQLPRQPVAHAA